MSDSDEDRHVLEDESMDEMYELEDALQVSVDTNASLSPVKHKGHPRLERRDSDDGESDDSGSDSDDDNGKSDDSGASSSVEIPVKMAAVEFRDADVGDNANSEDSDEPPEIPGSPLAVSQAAVPSSAGFMNSLSDMGFGNSGEVVRQRQQTSSSGPDILRIHHRGNDSSSSSSDDDEYIVRETEQPRSAEFNASSSSDSGDGSADSSGSDSDSDSNNRSGSRRPRGQQLALQHSNSSRPKTAATDLALYRDAIPDAFFEQLDASGDESHTASETLQNVSASHRQQQTREKKPSRANNSVLVDTQATTSPSTSSIAATSSAAAAAAVGTRRNEAQEFAMPVPQEVEDLFQFVDAYLPERIEIATRLEPFIPDYAPTIGLPFDGLQIARPDGKPDSGIGLQVLREPASSSNVAELELLMQTQLSKRRAARKTPFVHSIENAERRPREIDQWVESVAKVQSAKPLARVVYKKSMPTLESLMELWPEEMETFLAQRSVTAVTTSLSTLDVTLDELVQLVCVLLDIPVYAGSRVESLHVLFSLYHEIESYERDMAQHQNQHQRGSIR